jgi:hypothetical protein
LAIPEDVVASWWKIADDLLFLGKRLPTQLIHTTQETLAGQLKVEGLIRVVAAELSIVRVALAGMRTFDVRQQLWNIHFPALEHETDPGFERTRVVDRKMRAVVGGALATEPQPVADVLAWRAWIHDGQLASRYVDLERVWEDTEVVVSANAQSTQLAESAGTSLGSPGSDSRFSACDPTPPSARSPFDAPWATLGFAKAVPGTPPTEVFVRYLERATAFVPSMLSGDPLPREVAYQRREVIDAALVLLAGFRFQQGLHVSDFARGIGFSAEFVQRVSTMADRFRRTESVDLTHVLEVGDPGTNTYHDNWIRPGSVTDHFGLYRVDRDGGVVDYATESYRPADDDTRRPQDWIMGNIVARGGIVPDLRHISAADAETAWGQGFTAAVNRIRAGDNAPTVSGSCKACNMESDLTFPIRFCVVCGSEMLPGSYILLRDVEPLALSSGPPSWTGSEFPNTVLAQSETTESTLGSQDRAGGPGTRGAAQVTQYHQHRALKDGRTVHFMARGGRSEGAFIVTDSDSHLVEQGTHARGKVEGISEAFAKSGQLTMRVTFRGGKKNGIAETYHPNGEPKLRSEYRNDKAEGAYEAFDEDGRTLFRGTVTSGRVETVEAIDALCARCRQQGSAEGVWCSECLAALEANEIDRSADAVLHRILSGLTWTFANRRVERLPELFSGDIRICYPQLAGLAVTGIDAARAAYIKTFESKPACQFGRVFRDGDLVWAQYELVWKSLRSRRRLLVVAAIRIVDERISQMDCYHTISGPG